MTRRETRALRRVLPFGELKRMAEEFSRPTAFGFALMTMDAPAGVEGDVASTRTDLRASPSAGDAQSRATLLVCAIGVLAIGRRPADIIDLRRVFFGGGKSGEGLPSIFHATSLSAVPTGDQEVDSVVARLRDFGRPASARTSAPRRDSLSTRQPGSLRGWVPRRHRESTTRRRPGDDALHPCGPIPLPGVIERGVDARTAKENDRASQGRHCMTDARGRSGAVLSRPCVAVPLPRVTYKPASASIQTAEKDDVTAERRHRAASLNRGRCRVASTPCAPVPFPRLGKHVSWRLHSTKKEGLAILARHRVIDARGRAHDDFQGPLTPVPFPRVEEIRIVLALSPEQHHAVVQGRHRVAVASLRPLDLHGRPGASVPFPSVVQSVCGDPAKEDHLVSEGGHRVIGPPGRSGCRLHLLPCAAVELPSIAQKGVRFVNAAENHYTGVRPAPIVTRRRPRITRIGCAAIIGSAVDSRRRAATTFAARGAWNIAANVASGSASSGSERAERCEQQPASDRQIASTPQRCPSAHVQRHTRALSCALGPGRSTHRQCQSCDGCRYQVHRRHKSNPSGVRAVVGRSAAVEQTVLLNMIVRGAAPLTTVPTLRTLTPVARASLCEGRGTRRSSVADAAMLLIKQHIAISLPPAGGRADGRP